MAKRLSVNGLKIYREGPTKLCKKCGRFMAIDKQKNLLPHKYFISGKWCVSPMKDVPVKVSD